MAKFIPCGVYRQITDFYKIIIPQTFFRRPQS